MRVPVFCTFLPVLALCLAVGVTTVTIFAVMHDDVVHDAMVSSISDSLRFATHKVAAPLGKLRDDTIDFRNSATVKKEYGWQEARPPLGEWVEPYDFRYLHSHTQDMMLKIATSNKTYTFIYQSMRKRYPYDEVFAVNPTTRSSDDYPWSDMGCGADYCDFPFDQNYSFGIDFSYPDRMDNFTVTYNDPWDSQGDLYTQLGRTLTNSTEDWDGKWTALEFYVFVNDVTGRVDAGVLYTYAAPLTFDPISGDITSFMNIDMNCAWMTQLVSEMGVVASDITILVPETRQVLASSFKSLQPGYNAVDPDDVESFVLWDLTSAPEERLKRAVKALESQYKDLTLATLPNEAMLLTDVDDAHIFSAQPIRESKLNLLVVLVTDRGHYFDEGTRARNEAIGISFALLVVMVAITVAIAVLLTRPLSRLGHRMYLTASLQDEDADDTPSMLSEVAEMQEAYCTMREQLGRLKSYLPQSVLMGMIGDDDDDEGELKSAYSSAYVSGRDGSHHNSASRSAKAGDHGSSLESESTRLSKDSKYSAHVGVGSTPELNTKMSVVQKHVAVLCVNLVKFHREAAGSRVIEICELQRDYLEIVQKCVRDQKGVIDFFQGDRVVATFNAVTHAAACTKRAAACARSMIAALREVDTMPPAAIGVAAGSATVGNMGTKEMQRFNVIGECYTKAIQSMQVASRLVKQTIATTEHNLENAEDDTLLGDPSRVVSPMACTIDFGHHFYWQAVELQVFDDAQQKDCDVLVSIEQDKTSMSDEWMYELHESAKADPYGQLNDVFEDILARNGHVDPQAMRLTLSALKTSRPEYMKLEGFQQLYGMFVDPAGCKE